MPTPSLLQHLKERKLVQWALAYLAGAFVVFQLMDALETPLGLSAGIQQAILAILAVGFFVTLVLAWYHGEKGRQRVSGPELLMVAALLVVAGGVLAMLGGGEEAIEPVVTGSPSAAEDEQPSIAVLPFQNRSGQDEDAHFTAGMHDQIITQLTKISGLSVRGLTSVLVYRDSPKNLREIGEDLNARYIMEGGVQRAGGTVRINVQLIEAATDEHLWAHTYDRAMSLENLLSVQTEIVETVTDSVRAIITPEERRGIAAVPTKNLRAYDLYLEARSLWMARGVGESLRDAIELFEAAIAEDSTFALAYTGLAESYSLASFYRLAEWDVHQVFSLARDALEKAGALDPNLPDVHTVAGMIAYYYDWDWVEAERELRLAIELSPGSAQAHLQLGELLISMHRTDEAVAASLRAVQIDPRSNAANHILAFAFWEAGRLEEAERQFRRLIELDPEYYGGYRLGALLEQQGRFEEALEIHLANPQMDLEEEVDSLVIAMRAVEDTTLKGRAIRILRDYGSALGLRGMDLMEWHIHIGAVDEAVEAARLQVEARGPYVPHFNWVQNRALFSDPRFQAILDELGLPRSD